jgi:phospholipid/cholesterol/gamma-HCH transport system substrate-binding protein
MSLHLPRRASLAVLLFVVVSLALLAYMLGRLGTIPLPGSSTHDVRALVMNAGGLPVDADVLVHGVKVGSVSNVSTQGNGTVVTLALTDSAPSLHANGTIEVGTKTPLGEPYVDLDPGSGTLLRTHALLRSRSAVQIDDALAWLDAPGRANLRAVLASLGASTGPSTRAGVSDTLAALPGTVASLDGLASALRAQRADLTGVVTDGRSVLNTLAGRSSELRSLTVDARTTLDALAAQRTALAGTLARLPALLTLADSTLYAAKPLIARATPLVDQLATAAPSLTAALRALPSVTSSANTILSQAHAISTEVVPALRNAGALTKPAEAALAILGPVLADIVPVARYLGPRGSTIAAWFSNTAALGDHGDAKGDWARFFVMFDPSTMFGITQGSPPGNAYTAPNDAAHNAAYQPGGYPRLMPYAPALSRTSSG